MGRAIELFELPCEGLATPDKTTASIHKWDTARCGMWIFMLEQHSRTDGNLNETRVSDACERGKNRENSSF